MTSSEDTADQAAPPATHAHSDLSAAIHKLNQSSEHKIALENRFRDGHIEASLPRTRARGVCVADGLSPRVTGADVAKVADEARRALAPALRLLHVALESAQGLQQERGAGSPTIDLAHAITRFEDSARAIEWRFTRGGGVAAILPRSGTEAVLARNMADREPRMHDVALIAHEARLALKPALALLDAALGALAQLDEHAAEEDSA